MKWYPLPFKTLSQVFLHVLCTLILSGAGFRGAIRKMWKWRENWCYQDHLCLTDKCFRWYFWRFSDCKWCLISACHGCAGAIHTRPRQDFQRRARWWRWATSHREYIVKNPLDIKNTRSYFENSGMSMNMAIPEKKYSRSVLFEFFCFDFSNMP